MRDLLKEAIADAKAVRETALANAKIALEEAFTPRLQSMISARLREEEEMEEPEMTEEEEMEMDMPVEEGDEMDMEAPVEEGEDEDYMAEEDEMEMEEPVAEEEEMDAELEEILRELEGDEMEMEEPVAEEEEMEMEEPVAEGEEEEEVSIEEVIRALREEEEMEDEDIFSCGPTAETEKELAEAIRVIKFLKSKINEVNLLNAKLLFSNKLFRNYPLSESQKVKVIENFDRARTVREVKLVYGTISESLRTAKTKRPIVKESYASRPSKSTAPKKAILSEGNDLAARWKKLANLK